MKKVLFSLSVASLALLATSCGGNKTESTEDTADTTVMTEEQITVVEDSAINDSQVLETVETVEETTVAPAAKPAATTKKTTTTTKAEPAAPATKADEPKAEVKDNGKEKATDNVVNDVMGKLKGSKNNTGKTKTESPIKKD